MTAQPPGPDRPVPYSLTPKAEAELAAPELELEPDWSREWDDADSARYQARLEAGGEPEAELSDLESYPTFDDDPARWGLKQPEPQTAAELEAEATLEFWGPEGPYASYAEYLADGQPEPEPEAGS